MIKEVIGTGSSIEEALEDAKKQLGIEESVEIDYEVLQFPEKKKFGLFGGAPAKVKITLKSSPADTAEGFLRDVLNAMNLSSVEIEKTEKEDGVDFNLTGEEVGYVIGRRGETLDALQYLTSLVANNHKDDSYLKVTVDTGNYREKRETTLEGLGRKLAIKAAKTGRRTSLEPMNPYERRIIHTSVQKINGAISWSEGENSHRHVVIGPDPKNRNFRRGGYNNRGNRRPYNGSHSEQQTAVSSDRKPINEGGATGLYGRIDKIDE